MWFIQKPKLAFPSRKKHLLSRMMKLPPRCYTISSGNHGRSWYAYHETRSRLSSHLRAWRVRVNICHDSGFKISYRLLIILTEAALHFRFWKEFEIFFSTEYLYRSSRVKSVSLSDPQVKKKQNGILELRENANLSQPEIWASVSSIDSFSIKCTAP